MATRIRQKVRVGGGIRIITITSSHVGFITHQPTMMNDHNP